MTAIKHVPLADRLRPQRLSEFVGQKHLLGKNKPLATSIANNQPHSMIFWGPPGTGKTTLARLLANHIEAEFIALSAVFSGVKDIRQAIDTAKKLQTEFSKPTLLFIDEVHRFNKAQQDAFLPFVENGTVLFIGATTENPSFALNNALLSRARVYQLKPHTNEDLLAILKRALDIAYENLSLTDAQLQWMSLAADGDARQALNLLEMVHNLAKTETIDDQLIKEVCNGTRRRYDKQGDYFYDLISALHKSVRGSDPNAALYWLARILDAGCDPLYVARRIVRMASEDIGNADPKALQVALNAWETQERLGSPEGELALAQAIAYLACAAKSNAVYTAFKKAIQDVKDYGSLEVPMHLRNKPTKLMENLGYGKNYRYAHDEIHGYVAGEQYFPDALKNHQYYHPVDRGLEIKIKEKLAFLRKLDKERE